MSGSPKNTDIARESASRARRSRIGRRVVGLFVLSSLVPLCLCALILFREFGSALTRADEESLDGVVRTFRTTLLGRLENADDAFTAITSASGATADSAEAALRGLPWVRGITRSWPQQNQMRDGHSVLVWAADRPALSRIHLGRKLPDGAWLYAEIEPSWLWADSVEYAGDAALRIVDGNGLRIFSLGDIPATADTTSSDPSSDGWMSRSREIFLQSRFSSQPWQLVALRERSSLLNDNSYAYAWGVILLTITLIAWVSVTSIRRQLRPLSTLTEAAGKIADRNFEAFPDMPWNDEFGDLAQAFRLASGKLKTQFAALEALADVDRLLLGTAELESILDNLLPRIAAILQSDTASVLLIDADSDEHARIYDYCSMQPGPSQLGRVSLRRVAMDTAAFRAACVQSSNEVSAQTARDLHFLGTPLPEGISSVRLMPLSCDDKCVGALCLGYIDNTVGHHDAGIGAADFADRLSLILANLNQAERLREHANFDSLTGLQNRRVFAECVSSALRAVSQADGTSGSLLYIDLDHFKRVNDSAGHAAGDALLRVIAQRLVACAGAGAHLARLGGDEFAILLPRVAGRAAAQAIAEQIVSSLHPPIQIDGREHYVSASIGVTLFPEDGSTFDQLLKSADIAMYQAKDAGRSRAVFFHSDMQQKLLARLSLETGIKRALAHNEFTVHYQPIVNGSGGFGVEALVRWPSADLGPWIGPNEFIPVAEENGSIVALGDWVLRRACEQLQQWRRAGTPVDYVSVNVSVRELREPDYVSRLRAALERCGLQGKDLQVEITESVLAHAAQVEKSLAEISDHGVRLALDDFGTGYSSLRYLRSFPVHTVKIDRAFVLGLPGDPMACRLVESIILMCGGLGKNVVAEGVETEAQRSFLERCGCTAVQGYLLARPMEADDIPQFARRLRWRGESGSEHDEETRAPRRRRVQQ